MAAGGTFSMEGWAGVLISYRVVVTDFRVLPAFVPMIWSKNPISGDWTQCQGVAPAFGGTRGPLSTSGGTVLNIPAGVPNCIVVVDILTGQGASVDIYLERIN